MIQKCNSEPDFKFVALQKSLSVENEFNIKEGLLLNTYLTLKKPGSADAKAFTPGKNNVVTENIPLIYQSPVPFQLLREQKNENV